MNIVSQFEFLNHKATEARSNTKYSSCTLCVLVSLWFKELLNLI